MTRTDWAAAVVTAALLAFALPAYIDHAARQLATLVRRHRYKQARREERGDAERAAVLATILYRAHELAGDDHTPAVEAITGHVMASTPTTYHLTYDCGCWYRIPPDSDPSYSPCSAHELLQDLERKARR